MLEYGLISYSTDEGVVMKRFFSGAMLLVVSSLLCVNVFAGDLEDMGHTSHSIGFGINMADPSVFFQARQAEAQDMINELEIASLPNLDDVPLDFQMPKEGKK